MKIKFPKIEKHFKKERFSFDLNFYWKLAVFSILIITLVSFFFGFYVFLQTNEENILPEESIDGQVETVKKERIIKALEYFYLREKNREKIINSPSPVADPSI